LTIISPALEGMLSEARAGTAGALAALLDAVRPLLLRVADCRTHDLVRAGLEASDLVQETLIKAAEEFGKFAGTSEGQLFSWLWRILLNNLRDHLRSRKRCKRDAHREISLTALGPETLLLYASPEEEIERQEAYEGLHKAILHLPIRYQTVLAARFFEARSFAEIAEEMQCSADAARKSCERALNVLRRILRC